MTDSNPFDFVNSINAGNDIIGSAEDPSKAEEGYNPHLTNRAFSNHVDSVMYANEMNMRWGLDKSLQYYYYLYTLRPRKRYGKWHKASPKKNVQAVQALFPCNDQRAVTVLSLLTKDQIKQIQDMANKSDNKNEPTTKIGQGNSS